MLSTITQTELEKVSVVMPCLNEEKTIGQCIRKSHDILSEHNLNYEILVSDNGSEDKSINIAMSEGAVLIHTKERGYGNAYKNGFKYAQGKYIVMFDSDLTYDPAEIPKFLDKLKTTGADLVIGSRLKGNIEKGAMPALHRYIGNPFLTFVLNMLFGTKISDSHCGMRAFTREAYERLNLNSEGMEFASEMVVKAALLQMKIAEIPISYYARPEGSESKLNSFSDGYRHLRFLISSWLDNSFPFNKNNKE